MSPGAVRTGLSGQSKAVSPKSVMTMIPVVHRFLRNHIPDLTHSALTNKEANIPPLVLYVRLPYVRSHS